MEVSVRDVAPLRRATLEWYAREHRNLPWRGTHDPYAVLVSEVMLQQTQANRVALRYPRFMARFPDVTALASASEAEILAEWSGLGYNRRAVALHRAAVIVATSGWPADLRALQDLPGVGSYTARAIGSLAFGWPVGVVDTNVRRWLVRRLGLDPRSTAGANRALQQVADVLASAGGRRLEPADVATWTHASMDLGAVVCRPQRPACDACPIARGCPARGRAGPVPVARQGRFRGSLRAYRGALLRALAAASEHALPRSDVSSAMTRHSSAGGLNGAFDAQRIQVAIEGLERDGLVHADGQTLRLGPKEPPATIAE